MISIQVHPFHNIKGKEVLLSHLPNMLVKILKKFSNFFFTQPNVSIAASVKSVIYVRYPAINANIMPRIMFFYVTYETLLHHFLQPIVGFSLQRLSCTAVEVYYTTVASYHNDIIMNAQMNTQNTQFNLLTSRTGYLTR